LSEEPRVLLYIAADQPRSAEVTNWLARLEDAGVEVAHAIGHEPGRFALQTGVVSVLVIDQALGRASCLFLLREGQARDTLDAVFILRDNTARFDERVLTDAGASGVIDRAELASLELSTLLPDKPASKDDASSNDEDSHAFMSRLSHEIRTPLHGIHGAMDLLEETGMTPLQREYVHVVRNAADALMSVVHDLVDYAKPREDRGESEAFPFEPRTCAERVAAVMGPKALAKGLDFAHMTHHDVPWRVKGDPNRLRQILNGLTGHVIRNTGRGAVVVDITAVEPSEGVAALCFNIGVVASEFGSTNKDRDESAPQIGDESDLSLERCTELVGQMGGHLRTQMTASGTVAFSFSIEFDALPDKLPLVEIGMDALEGREVLVVDDTAANRMVYREQLANWGCGILEASNGKEALDVISARASSGEGIDIALIDFAMQEMDGGALARAIRALPNGSDIRLVLCTSMPQGGDALRMSDAGFEAYLTKPVRFECLRKVMCLLLGSRPSERARTPLITQHIIAEMDRSARSTIYIGDSDFSGRDAILALQNHGFPCDTARFGEDSLRALASHRYAVVLVDCRPSFDKGLAAAASIRASDGGQRIPLFMIVRRAHSERQSACLAAGGDVVLVEPIQRDELVSVLSAYLGLEESSSPDDPIEDWDVEEAMAVLQDHNEVPVDLDRLEEVTAGDAELRQELIDIFMADTEERFLVLESAIAGKNGEELNRTAHSIKGSSANMGAAALQALAYELEAMGSENRFEEAPELFSSLKNEFEVVKVFFGSL
jgi:CheY-like chemotaxis protein/signal transduction histidine kinase/HPt (histidine-containing phosphotransfer) domain-containing protein